MRSIKRNLTMLLCLCLLASGLALAEETVLPGVTEVVSAPVELEVAEDEADLPVYEGEAMTDGLEDSAWPEKAVSAIVQPQSYTVDISSYDSFRNETMGKSFYLDGDFGAQCWDGAALLWSQLGMSLSTGGNNARGCWLNAKEYNAGTQFTLIYDYKQVKRGDVVVFVNPNNKEDYGHIGYANEDCHDGMTKLWVYGQNQGTGYNYVEGLPFRDTYVNSSGQTVRCDYELKDFLGAFRYKGWYKPIDEEFFPDAEFRSYVSAHYDTDKDGFLSNAERNVVTYIDVNDRKDIKDLTGIGLFRNLEALYCTGCGLSALDVSGCESLTELYCSNNAELKSLKVQGCAKLGRINCSDCGLVALDLSESGKLGILYVDNNQLTSLDISKTAIWLLSCRNNGMKKLKLNEACSTLRCQENKLSKLDISKCEWLVGLQDYVSHKNDKTSSWTISSKGVVHYESKRTKAELYFDYYTALMIDGKQVDGFKNAPVSVKLNKSGTVELEMSDTLKLKATIKPTSAVPYVSWKSLDTKVAKVSSSGKVTPVKPGTATIKVSTYNGRTAKVKVKVVPVKPSKVTITKGTKATMTVGDKLTLKAKLLPAGSTSKLTWKSSDTKVATVSSSGVVKAKKVGTAKITVKTANGKRATITITVKAKKGRLELSGYFGKSIEIAAKKLGVNTKKEWLNGFESWECAKTGVRISAYASREKVTDIYLSEKGNYTIFGAYPGMTVETARKRIREAAGRAGYTVNDYNLGDARWLYFYDDNQKHPFTVEMGVGNGIVTSLLMRTPDE